MNLLKTDDHIAQRHSVRQILDTTQGYILLGHGCDFLSYGFLRIGAGADAERMRKAFAALSLLVTSAERLVEDKATPKEMRPKELVVTAAGISSLGYRAMKFEDRFSPAFSSGFAKRAAGVTLQGTEPWNGIWQGGARYGAVVILAARLKGELSEVQKEVRKLFDGLGEFEWQDAFIDRPKGLPVEHFGFVDGVSQPTFFDNGKAHSAARQFGWDSKAPLSLVLVQDPFRSDSGLAEYGSYAAILHVEQHQDRFDHACAQLAQAVGCTPDVAAELVIGRKKNGDPLLPKGFDLNDIDVKHPDNERLWPMASHTRRMNFRKDPHRRILRRGVLYNNGDSKGLLFHSFQASLAEQFEFIFSAWANNPHHPKMDTGIDAITGVVPTTPQSWPLQNGQPGNTACPVHNLTTVRGGDYFYFPSIPALTAMPQQPFA